MIAGVGMDTPRALFALANDHGRVNYGRAWRALQWQAWAWTRLPGDRVRDFQLLHEGVIVRVRRPGRADVVWTTRESLYAGRPDVWLERDLDARRLWP